MNQSVQKHHRQQNFFSIGQEFLHLSPRQNWSMVVVIVHGARLGWKWTSGFSWIYIKENYVSSKWGRTLTGLSHHLWVLFCASFTHLGTKDSNFPGMQKKYKPLVSDPWKVTSSRKLEQAQVIGKELQSFFVRMNTEM